MTKTPTKKAVLLVALIVGAGLAPIAMSDHLNELVGIPTFGQPPATGSEAVDGALQTAFAAAQETADGINDVLEPRRAEPQVPATYFRDAFKFNQTGHPVRIGGFGDWQEVGDDGWYLGGMQSGRTTNAPNDYGLVTVTRPVDRPAGDHDYRFWDPSTGYYPVALSTDDSTILHSHLVSPRISLQSLPADLDPAETGLIQNADQDFAQSLPAGPRGGYSDPHRIILNIDHRYHFAGGRDGGRVEVYSREPTALDTAGSGSGTPLAPLRGQYAPASALGSGFTGAEGNWTQEAFDLTEWAGRDVWLVFHAATRSTTNRAFFFQNSPGFDPALRDQGFFGWDLDDVRIEGPAYRHNVRIDQLVHPDPIFCTSEAIPRCDAPSGPGQPEPTILVLNRGQVTEEFLPAMELDGAACTPVTGRVRLVPGQAIAVPFDCHLPDGLQDGQTYDAVFSVDLSSERPDLFPQDNSLDITLQGKDRRAIVFTAPLELAPRLGDENTLRTMKAAIRNDGLPREQLDVYLRVLWQDPALDPEDPFIDVSTDPSVVGPGFTPSLAPITLEPKAEAVLSWDFLLSRPGNYTIAAVVTSGGTILQEKEVSAGTLTAQGLGYRSLFDGSNNIQDLVAGQEAWSRFSIQETAPPCKTPPCPDYVWELPAHPSGPNDSTSPRNPSGGIPRVSLLAATVAPEALAQQPEFDSIRVRVVHRMDVRCSDAQECSAHSLRGAHAGPLVMQLALEDETTMTWADPNVGITPVDDNTPLLPEAEGGIRRVIHLQAVHLVEASADQNADVRNRNAYLTGQWIEEIFIVRPTDIHPSLTTIPSALLGSLTLRFFAVLTNHFCAPEEGSQETRADNFCPLWQIAEAEVEGIVGADDDGLTISLIRTTGREEDEEGTWHSRRSTQDCQQTVPDDPTNPYPCHRWRKRFLDDEPLDPVPVALQNLLQAPDLPRIDGAWTNADSGNAFTYPEGGRDMLASPALRIDADMGEPTLEFSHLFALHSPSFAASYQDNVMLMMRFMSQDGSEAKSPFLPVAIRYNRDAGATDPRLGITGQRQAYTGSDCSYYAIPSCPPALSNRQPVTEEIPLYSIPILDFRRVAPPVSGAIQGSIQSPDRAALLTVPDGPAERLFDLRQDCNGPCTVQFAFRVETITHVRTSPKAAEDLLHLQHQLPPGGSGGEGWYLTDFAILRERSVAHDLEVNSAELHADYDWIELGLGPGTSAALNLTVVNNGLFLETSALARLEIQKVMPDGSTETTINDMPLSGFALGPRQTTQISLPFVVPEQGTYRLLGRVLLVGQLVPGLPLIDGDATNDCATVDQFGASLASTCAVQNAPRLRVAAAPLLDVTVDALPLAGRADFPRTYNIEIHNRGNVIVENAKLRRIIQPFSNGAPTVDEWNLPLSPAPGHSAQWTSLDPQPKSRFAVPLGKPGQYLVTVTLDGGAFSFDQVLLDAFDIFLSDTFEPGQRGLETSDIVDGGALMPSDANWTLDTGFFVSQGKPGAWHFGDSGAGLYADGADSTLELPSLDLSVAKRASISFLHRYAFEEGYDGGRLEVSLDGGVTWRPLEPRGGYGKVLFSESPLNPDQNPANATPAFSGSSLEVSPDTDGWINSEFSLGQIAELTQPVLTTRLSQEGFDNVILARPDPPDDRITRSATWHLPFQTCSAGLATCWYRENLNHRAPEIHPGAQAFWWTRSAGPLNADVTVSTELPLSIDVPATSEGEGTRLEFAMWKDPAGKSTVSFDGQTIQPVPIQANDGWTRFAVPLSSTQGTHVVAFTYEERGSTKSLDETKANRGMVIDDVRLITFTVDATGTEDITTMTPFAPDDVAWQPPLISPVPFCTEAGELCTDGQARWGWQSVPRVTDTREAWQITAQELTVRGTQAPIWWFGDLNGGLWNYPANAHERLVTPLLSLRSVGGDKASLTYKEHYYIAPQDTRRVLVQEVQPTPTGPQVGPWQLLPGSERTSAGASRSDTCPAAVRLRDWCTVDIDISSFVGKDVRFAFEIETTRANRGVGANSAWIGFHWGIDEVGIVADSLVGRPIDLRLRAGSDGSNGEGGWSIANLQVVGHRYQDNLAIIPEQRMERTQIAPGNAVVLSGLVRNLASNTQSQVFLHAVATPQPLADGSLPPAIDPVFVNDGQAQGTPYIGPLTLQKAGAPGGNDRLQYEIHLPLDEDTPEGATYRVTWFLGRSPDGTATLVDDNLGDHSHETLLEVATRFQLDIPHFLVTPPTVDAGQQVTVRMDLHNSGTAPLQATPRLKMRDLATGAIIATQVLPTVDLEPGQQRTVGPTWTPDRAGFYAVDAIIDQSFAETPLNLTLGHVMVDRLPIFFEEDFAGPANVIRSQWTNTLEGCDGTAHTTVQAGRNIDCWWLQDSDAYTGQRSFHAGVTAQEAQMGQSYQTLDNTGLVSPRIDLAMLGDVQRVVDSPFEPAMTFRYRSLLGCAPGPCNANDGVIVSGSNDDGENQYWIQGSYAHTVASGNPLAGAGIQPPRSPRPVLAGNSLTWNLATFPLGDDILQVDSSNREPVLGSDQVRFAFAFGSDSTAQTRGFTIDSIRVSSYDIEVFPKEVRPLLTYGSDKTFHVLVTNTGAAADALQVTVDPALAQYPSRLIEVEVLTPELTLEAGESGLASIHVAVRHGVRSGPVPTMFIPIQVASSADPNRIAQMDILARFSPEDLADLNVLLKRPESETGPVTEGETASLLALIDNQLGTAISKPTTLVVLACPDKPSTTILEDIGSCRSSKPGSPGAPRVLAQQTVPALLPGTAQPQTPGPRTSEHTLSWVPPLDSRGPYHILAVIDPLQTMRMLGTGSVLSMIPLQVLPIERPDILVTQLEVMNEDGQLTHHGFSGEPLTIRARVENLGNADARNVQISLQNQFELRRERIPVMVPGQSVDLTTTWVGQTGNWIIAMSASTPTHEIGSGNNARQWSLAVRPGLVRTFLDAQTVHIAPGEQQPVMFTLHNRRDGPVTLHLSSQAPADLTVLALPEQAILDRGARREIPLLISASPFATPQEVRLVLQAATQPGAPPLASATLHVAVAQHRNVTASAAPLATPPGASTLTLRLVNDGTATEVFDVHAEGPELWNVTVLNRAVRLAPQESVEVPIQIVMPPTTPPGTYSISVKGGPLQDSTLPVEVLAAPSWSSEILSSRSTADAIEAWMQVTNTGNLPGMPPMAQDNWTIDPPPGILQPGQSSAYRLTTSSESATLPLAGAGEPVLTRTTQRALLEITRLDITPAQGLREGQMASIHVVVKNSGNAPAPDVPVRLYVGGSLMATKLVDFGPQQTRQVPFTWQATPGDHVLTASAGSEERPAMAAEAANVGASPHAIPGPGFASIVLVAAAAFAMRRRRM